MLPAVEIHCPYCGESIALLVDDSVGPQRYVEDCQVCCRPIEIAVAIDDDGGLQVTASAENDG